MRQGIKNFIEFHSLKKWFEYTQKHMSNAVEVESDTGIEIKTGCGVSIATWQSHGYGFIEECRTSERLEKMV